MSLLRSVRPAVSALLAASVRSPAVPRVALRAAAVSATRIACSRGFASSRLARGEGESDVALSSRLQEEIKYEQENVEQAAAEEPEFLTEFKKEGVWEITDKPGGDEITLTRQFGNETVRVLFSIADIDTDAGAFPEETEDGEEEVTPSYPIRISVTVTKPDQGALTIDALAEEGTFVIDNISFYQDQKLATELTAQADWDRRGVYIGPHFDHLDVNVQEEFEKFLNERGVNDDLAMFIPDYAEWKEQKEYVKWLKNVKAFVDA